MPQDRWYAFYQCRLCRYVAGANNNTTYNQMRNCYKCGTPTYPIDQVSKH